MSALKEDGLGEIAIAVAKDEMERRYQKMRHVVAALDEAQLNWRPNTACNSVANLVTHLRGNIGERYCKTLGGQQFDRDREAEFATDVHLTPSEALAVLDEAFPAALDVIDGLVVADLIERAQLPTGQAYVVDFLLQTLTHYAEHVGQAILLAKAQGVRLGGVPN